MADIIQIRDAAGELVDVSVDDLTSLNGNAVTDVHIQRFKAVFGVDGTGVDVSASNPLPVTVTGTQTIAALTDGTAQFKFSAPTGQALSNVSASTSSVTLKAANTDRRGLYVFNDSTANLYLKLGATASISSFTVKVPAASLYELPAPFYRGVVDGIWDAANGSARVTEIS